MKEFLSILRSSPLFAGISDREILQTLEIFGAKIKNFKKDEFILRAGEPVEGVGVLLSGSGLILREDFWGNRNILASVGVGDCFGEAFACSGGAESNVGVIACEECRALFVSVKRLLCDSGCPGTHSKRIERHDRPECGEESHVHARSMLSQWPVQIKLVPVNAPYFDGARLLVAADCTAYAYGAFHEDFIKNHITLVGCPKLDSVDYSEKLTEIIRTNDIKSVTVVRMEVPCCGGLENAVKKALQASGKFIPWQVVTISTDGRILDK